RSGVLPGPTAIHGDGDGAVALPPKDQAVPSAGVVAGPLPVAGGRRADDIGTLESERHLIRTFVDDAFLVIAVAEVGSIAVRRIGVPSLACVVAGRGLCRKRVLRLIDPRAPPLGPRHAGRHVIPPPEDERLPVLEAGLEIPPKRLSAPEVDPGRRAGVPAQGRRAVVFPEGAGRGLRVVRTHRPAALPLGLELGIGEPAEVGLDLVNALERPPF